MIWFSTVCYSGEIWFLHLMLEPDLIFESAIQPTFSAMKRTELNIGRPYYKRTMQYLNFLAIILWILILPYLKLSTFIQKFTNFKKKWNSHSWQFYKHSSQTKWSENIWKKLYHPKSFELTGYSLSECLCFNRI